MRRLPPARPSTRLRRAEPSASLALLAGIAAASAIAPARAQAIVCTNCAQETSALAQLAKQADSYAAQIQSIQLQLRQWANQVQNTLGLPQQIWANVQADLARLRQLTQATALLSGNSGSIISKLNSVNGYANQLGNAANIGTQLTTWQQQLWTNYQALGKTLGLQDAQAQNNANVLQSAEQHSAAAAGQMQAIQAGTEVAASNGAVLQEIRATLAESIQYQAQRDTVADDRRAAQAEATREYYAPINPPITGGQGW